MKPIIEVNNISKQYRLGTIGTGSMSHDLNRWWHRLRGKDDPYLRIGEANDRSAKGSSDYVWALRDISFSVQPGEVLGIIGRNGAGKSTLLKILSRITTPSTGSIKLGGRVASLLEVGTGMHPELTGRENIYLNGAILGMRKKEIDRKLDAIVDFSGVERYLDTPVKRYSSGMHVRLGFAVAAHLEPEVLIVDEVLAVGDAEFQKKCLGKMKDVSSNEGRTVLFVSHNMAAVRNICNRLLILKNGSVEVEGELEGVLNHYLSSQIASKKLKDCKASCGTLIINEFYIKDAVEKLRRKIDVGEKLTVVFNISAERDFPKITIGFALNDLNNTRVVTAHSLDDERFTKGLKKGKHLIDCLIDTKQFGAGMYSYDIGIRNEFDENIIRMKEVGIIEFVENNLNLNGGEGLIRPEVLWSKISYE